MIAYFGSKTAKFYKGLRIKADLGVHEEIVKNIELILPRGAKILDFGAGEGALSERLADSGYDVTAVDINEKDYKATKAKFFQLNFNDQITIDNFVDQHQSEFDAVLSIEVIEHVEDQWSYVRQLLKMVKQGGVVLITTPNITSWLSRLIFLLRGRFHQFADSDLSYGHINPICSWRLRLILEQCGASRIEIKPAGTLPPIYFGANKLHTRLVAGTVSLLVLPLYWLMRGMKSGWCIMAIAHRK